MSSMVISRLVSFLSPGTSFENFDIYFEYPSIPEKMEE